MRVKSWSWTPPADLLALMWCTAAEIELTPEQLVDGAVRTYCAILRRRQREKDAAARMEPKEKTEWDGAKVEKLLASKCESPSRKKGGSNGLQRGPGCRSRITSVGDVMDRAIGKSTRRK